MTTIIIFTECVVRFTQQRYGKKRKWLMFDRLVAAVRAGDLKKDIIYSTKKLDQI